MKPICLYPALIFFNVLLLCEAVEEQQQRGGQQQPQFYFTKGNGEQRTVIEGEENLLLQCAVSNNDNVQFRWSLNGKLLANTTRRYQVGSDLFISPVLKDRDEGNFTCTALSLISGFTLNTLPQTLNFIWISHHASAHLSSPGREAEIGPGVQVILKCQVEGTNHITFTWFRNGEILEGATGKLFHIPRASPDDNGSYTCSARNDAAVAEAEGKFQLIIRGDKIPKLLKGPDDKIGRRTSSVRFDCVFETGTRIRWYFGDTGPLQDSFKYTLHPNGSLTIGEIEPEDVGLYKCLGNFHDFPETPLQTYSASLKLAFLEELTIKSLETPPLVDVGRVRGGGGGRWLLGVREKSRVELFCRQPVGLPMPVIWWVGPHGKRIPDSSSSSSQSASAVIQDGNTLLIENVGKNLSGNYSCIHENIYGRTSVGVQLVVTTEASIVGHPLPTTIVDEGESAVFTCLFNGGGDFSVSQVRWLRNGFPIPQAAASSSAEGGKIQQQHHHQKRRQEHPSLDHDRVVGGGGGGGGELLLEKNPGRIRFGQGTPTSTGQQNATLVIKPVGLTDAATYTCEIITPGFPNSVHSRPAQLFVTETLKFLPKPVDKKLELGSSAKIHCKAHGNPSPIVRWLRPKEGEPLFQLPSHLIDSNGTLHFPNVLQSDAGQYICVASSTQGIINSSIQVEVIVPPKFVVTPRNPTEAVEGQSVLVNCAAFGDPIPTIQWDKNKILNGFDHKRFHVLENGSLFISKVSRNDDGLYACTAGNAWGLKREEVKLIVISSNDQFIFESTEDGNVMTRTVSITLSVAAGYMLLVIGLMLWCRYRQLQKKIHYQSSCKENGDAEMKETGPVGNGTTSAATALLQPNGRARKASSGDSVKSEAKSTHSSIGGCGKEASATASLASHKSQASQQSKRSCGSSVYDSIAFPRQHLQFVMLLGHGEFGPVKLAKAKNLREGEADTLVMVKSLETRDETALFDFKREIDMYYKMNHENVNRVVKLCRDTDPHYIIMEYSDWGDLKQFLLATRQQSIRKVPTPPTLTMSQILQVVSQVALGMEHLANKRFVHKDLATRNCLISSGLRIKISNPSLSKDTYSSEYHNYKNQNLPIRWMPSEALVDDEYSTKSDIWSFGVLIWEVIHQAAMPFENQSNQLIVERLERKEVLWNANDMMELIPRKLVDLLTKCWSCPKNRPSFSNVAISLDEILRDILCKSKSPQEDPPRRLNY